MLQNPCIIFTQQLFRYLYLCYLLYNARTVTRNDIFCEIARASLSVETQLRPFGAQLAESTVHVECGRLLINGESFVTPRCPINRSSRPFSSAFSVYEHNKGSFYCYVRGVYIRIDPC